MCIHIKLLSCVPEKKRNEFTDTENRFEVDRGNSGTWVNGIRWRKGTNFHLYNDGPCGCNAQDEQ